MKKCIFLILTFLSSSLLADSIVLYEGRVPNEANDVAFSYRGCKKGNKVAIDLVFNHEEQTVDDSDTIVDKRYTAYPKELYVDYKKRGVFFKQKDGSEVRCALAKITYFTKRKVVRKFQFKRPCSVKAKFFVKKIKKTDDLGDTYFVTKRFAKVILKTNE